MQRNLGMKRSFNYDDLSSIVGLDRHARVGRDALTSLSRKRVKRVRATSLDSTLCTNVCYCCEEAGKPMPAAIAPSTSSVDSLTPKAPAPAARLISPATSHVAVTPELAPSLIDELSTLPCFPSLRSRNESRDFPATAALERFMLKQRYSPETTVEDELDGDFSPSFEDPCAEEAYRSWPKLDQDGLPTLSRVDDFARQARRVSLASRKSSLASDSDSPYLGNQMHKKSSLNTNEPASKIRTSPVSFSSLSSPFEPHLSHHIPSIGQITEEFAKM